MPGFLTTNYSKPSQLENYNNEKCVRNEFRYKNITVKRNTLNKFLDDKLFYEDDSVIIVLDGVIFNKRVLMSKSGKDSWAQTVKQMYTQCGVTFFGVFRGPFSGMLYDKCLDQILVFTNHYADNTVFYCVNCEKKSFAVGSQVNYLLELLKENGAAISLDEKSVYDMLTYGFMEDNNTWAEQIRRLRPGEYIVIKLQDEQSVGSFDTEYYYRMGQTYTDLSAYSEAEIVDRLDELFRQAIELEYEKDNEYHLSHLSDLSGGLDSRMNTWVAHSLGYSNITNISYSLVGYLDMTIPQKIAADLGHTSIFMSLDDAKFMLDIDKLISMNYGLAMYSFITGGQRLREYRYIRNRTYGTDWRCNHRYFHA